MTRRIRKEMEMGMMSRRMIKRRKSIMMRRRRNRKIEHWMRKDDETEKDDG